MYNAEKSLITKTVVLIVLIIFGSVIVKTFEPTLATKVAIAQLNNGDAGFVQLQLYNEIKFYTVVGYCIFAVLLYCNDIAMLLHKLLNKKYKNN